jgi:magnesium transporter
MLFRAVVRLRKEIMIRLFSIKENLVTEMKFEGENLASSISAASWVDARSPTDEERIVLESLLKTEFPEPDDVDEIEDSARCFIDQAGVHIHSLFLSQSEGRANTVSVACILQQNRLITVRDERLPDFRLFRMRARRGQVESANPTEILIGLMEQKVENLADALEGIHGRLESIGSSVLGGSVEKPEEVVSLLAVSEDGNGKVRLCLMDTHRDISFLHRHLKAEAEVNETFREITRDIDTLLSHTTFLFDKINFLMGFMQGFINIQQNQIIKIFSIAAVILLPPTLVASIYGMNFKYMPELNWLLGYPWAIVLMIISGIAPYLYFKRKGWL